MKLTLAALVILAVAYIAIRAKHKRDMNAKYIAMQCAVNAISLEYRALINMKYSAREARANVRAYVLRNYGATFNNDERAQVTRDGIQHAQMIIAGNNYNLNIEGYTRFVN